MSTPPLPDIAAALHTHRADVEWLAGWLVVACIGAALVVAGWALLSWGNADVSDVDEECPYVDVET